MLNEQILILSKKHGQLKQAVTKMVQVVMGFLDQVSNIDTKLSVIETLRTVTEGKVRLAALKAKDPDEVVDTMCRSLLRSKEHASRAYYQT